MAIGGAPTEGRLPTRRDPIRRALNALFPEARRLQRRRRLRYAVVLLLMSVIVVGLLRATASGSNGTVPVIRGPHATVVSLTLPPAGHFSSLTVIGGRLILSGGPQGSLPASGYQTSLVDGRAAGTCDSAALDPRTLAVGRIVSANCGDPALYGERVLPIAYLLRSVAPNGGATGVLAVRIARAQTAAPDGYTLGPVLTTYPQCSDCQIAWIYGDDSLWIYNPLADPPRGPGILMRISTRTGAVLERWSMPEIVRALLAVDSDGLWLSPSLESGTPQGIRTSQRGRYQSLYRIAPGDGSPQRMLAEGGEGARWLLAGGDTASVAVDNDHGYPTVWTFTDHQQPVHGPALNQVPAAAEFGTGDPTVAGNARIGFYNVVLRNDTESVIEVAPDGAHSQTIATIRSRDVSVEDPAPIGVALDGSFFFLDPPTSESADSRQLHRVTAHSIG